MNIKDNMKQKNRIAVYDNLRGFFSLAVFNGHCIPILFPTLVGTTVWSVINYTPFVLFRGSGFGVSYFFVLSGYGITKSIYDNKWRSICWKCIRRYLRLLPVIFICVSLSALSMKLGIYYLTPGILSDSGEIKFTAYYRPDININMILRDTFWDVFFRGSSFVSPFWTMKMEIRGSILISIIVPIMRKRTLPMKVLIMLVLLFACSYCSSTYYYSLLCGVILYLIMRYIEDKQIRVNAKIGRVILIIGLFFTYMVIFWAVSPFEHWADYTCFSGIGFSLIMLGLYYDKTNFITRFSEKKIVSCLGSISYSIYGIHYIVISTIGCMLINTFDKKLSIIEMLFVYAVVLIATIFFAKVIDSFDKCITLMRHHINTYFFKDFVTRKRFDYKM